MFPADPEEESPVKRVIGPELPSWAKPLENDNSPLHQRGNARRKKNGWKREKKLKDFSLMKSPVSIHAAFGSGYKERATRRVFVVTRDDFLQLGWHSELLNRIIWMLGFINRLTFYRLLTINPPGWSSWEVSPEVKEILPAGAPSELPVSIKIEPLGLWPPLLLPVLKIKSPLTPSPETWDVWIITEPLLDEMEDPDEMRIDPP